MFSKNNELRGNRRNQKFEFKEYEFKGNDGWYIRFSRFRNDVAVLFEMSQILNCGLDKKSLEICVAMLENGVNPEALAAVVKEIKRNTPSPNTNTCTFSSLNTN